MIRKWVFCSREFVLSNSIAVLFVSVVASVEINRRVTSGATYVIWFMMVLLTSKSIIHVCISSRKCSPCCSWILTYTGGEFSVSLPYSHGVISNLLLSYFNTALYTVFRCASLMCISVIESKILVLANFW